MKLFGDSELSISRIRFDGWPDHMRQEFALLTAEAGLSALQVMQQTGIPVCELATVRDATYRPFARTFPDGMVPVEETPHAPHMPNRRKGQGDARG